MRPVMDFLDQLDILAHHRVVRFELQGALVGGTGFAEQAFMFICDRHVVEVGGAVRGELRRPLGDLRYPAALAAIYDPPPILWTRGHPESLQGPMVAIVGSRAASPYALEVARRLGADLARRHVAVVSGMARGVDSAAHQGALDGGGVTVAVFGCGVDVIYPSEHAALAARIRECGALVSEF